MVNYKKILLYFFYFIIVTLLFLYLLFPSEKVGKVVVNKVNEINPEFKISIEEVSPLLSAGLEFSRVGFYIQGKYMGDADSLSVKPEIMSLFNPVPNLEFEADLFEGTLNGSFVTVEEDKGRKNTILESTVSQIQISKKCSNLKIAE